MTDKFFMWLGHDHHTAKRELIESEQRAIDEARLLAVSCPVIEDDGE